MDEKQEVRNRIRARLIEQGRGAGASGLMRSRVARAAREVVKGHAEIVRKEHRSAYSRFLSASLVMLIRAAAHAIVGGYFGLRYFFISPAFFQAFRKRHSQDPLTAYKNTL